MKSLKNLIAIATPTSIFVISAVIIKTSDLSHLHPNIQFMAPLSIMVTIMVMGIGSGSLSNRYKIPSIPYGFFLLYQLFYMTDTDIPFRVEILDDFFEFDVINSGALTCIINFVSLCHICWDRMKTWEMRRTYMTVMIILGFLAVFYLPFEIPDMNFYILLISLIGYFLGLIAPKMTIFPAGSPVKD
ncbi:MAG: hypothetical protein JW984_12855 [Deltaproteobacteria bacterium]|uniref:Uncharacterized protein n=1 Tax=Candidatus Zymogenus saltonus TaxID=2844893 RepID=A0A9D8KH69_9DELT|nr:hypothetical protein [Candidatus Zymogenus saltonus]